MKTEKGLEVYLGSDKVGILAETSNHKVAFSYSDVFHQSLFIILEKRCLCSFKVIF